MNSNRQKGVTLLELAIVVLIIASIAAVIVIARNMVRASQLRAVISEQQQYAQAISNFHDKYLAMPGDFAGATALWGTATSCYASNTNATGTKTCNGNGDGHIGSFGFSAGIPAYEPFLAWQHLANANFISGHYTGTTGPNGFDGPYPDIVAGTNIPASELKGAGWYVIYYNESIPVGAITYSYNTHALFLDGRGAQYGQQMIGVMTPQEALSLDNKVDDGLPFTGNVAVQYYLSKITTTCYVSNANTYDTSAAAKQFPTCALMFLMNQF